MRVCVIRKNIFPKGIVKKPDESAGFSLAETIVAACIFLVLVNMALATLNTGMNSWFTGNASVELRSEVIKAFSAIEKDIKRTAPAQTNLGAGNSASTISFHFPGDLDSDGTIIDWNGTSPLYEPTIEWSPVVVTYELNASGEIIRRNTLGQSRVVARNISSLQFSRPAVISNIMEVNITAQKMDSKRRTVRDTATLMIKMRNH